MPKLTLTPDEKERRTRALTVLALLAILIVVVFIVSMNTGFMRLSPLEVLHTLMGDGTHQQKLILFDFRLPRIVISLLVGAGFAVSGCILQSLARNALAEPATLGISAGAGFAVIIFISFFPATTAAPVFVLPLLALGGAGTDRSFNLYSCLPEGRWSVSYKADPYRDCGRCRNQCLPACIGT